MAEVAAAGEDHREALLVGGGDDLVVADRATGLDDGSRTGRGSGVEAVAEREERVACACATLGSAIGLVGGDEAGVAAVLLAGADADGLTVLRQDDRVAGDGGGDLPREGEVLPLGIARRTLGDDLPVVGVRLERVGVL